MKRARGNNTLDIIAAVLLWLIAMFIGYQIGHDKGVKDHATGKYVTVELPNGDTIVVENKR